MTSDEARRRELLREALQTRRADVARLVHTAETSEVAAATDIEEALRVTMVRLVPALRAEHAGRAELEALADPLEGLREPARGDDLRFLDAWNSAYEALVSHPPLLADPAARRILAAYAGLLDDQLRRLGD
jgi:hypothetical protein